MSLPRVKAFALVIVVAAIEAPYGVASIRQKVQFEGEAALVDTETHSFQTDVEGIAPSARVPKNASSASIPKKCVSFAVACGLDLSDDTGVTTWGEVSVGFKLCCIAAGHKAEACDGVATDLWKGKSGICVFDNTLCDELDHLRTTHNLWWKQAGSALLVKDRVKDRADAIMSQMHQVKDSTPKLVDRILKGGAVASSFLALSLGQNVQSASRAVFAGALAIIAATVEKCDSETWAAHCAKASCQSGIDMENRYVPDPFTEETQFDNCCLRTPGNALANHAIMGPWFSDNTVGSCGTRESRKLEDFAAGSAIGSIPDLVVGIGQSIAGSNGQQGAAQAVGKAAQQAAKKNSRTIAKLAFAGVSGAAGPLAGVAFGFMAEHFIPDPNNARIEALQDSVDCLQEEIGELRGDLNALADYVNKLAERVNQVENKVNKNTGAIADLLSSQFEIMVAKLANWNKKAAKCTQRDSSVTCSFEAWEDQYEPHTGAFPNHVQVPFRTYEDNLREMIIDYTTKHVADYVWEFVRTLLAVYNGVLALLPITYDFAFQWGEEVKRVDPSKASKIQAGLTGMRDFIGNLHASASLFKDNLLAGAQERASRMPTDMESTAHYWCDVIKDQSLHGGKVYGADRVTCPTVKCPLVGGKELLPCATHLTHIDAAACTGCSTDWPWIAAWDPFPTCGPHWSGRWHCETKMRMKQIWVSECGSAQTVQCNYQVRYDPLHEALNTDLVANLFTLSLVIDQPSKYQGASR